MDSYKIKAFDHCELYVGNAKQSAHYYEHALGFEPISYKGLETGNKEYASYVLKQDKIRIVLTTPLNSKSRIRIMSAEPDAPFRLNDVKIDTPLEDNLACLVKVENSKPIQYPVYCGWNILAKFPNIISNYLLELGGGLGSHAGPGALVIGLQKIDLE